MPNRWLKAAAVFRSHLELQSDGPASPVRLNQERMETRAVTISLAPAGAARVRRVTRPERNGLVEVEAIDRQPGHERAEQEPRWTSFWSGWRWPPGKEAMRDRSRTWLFGALILCAIGPAPARTQEPSDSASRAARAFYDAIGARRWDAVATLVHPDRLRVVRSNLRMMVNADTSGVVLAELLGLSDRAAFELLPDASIFERVLRTLERRMEPLARVISTNEVEVVGAVPDGNEAHVVVRVTPYADGSRPTWVRVLTVRRDGGQWRVADAEELTTVITAVLGLPLDRRPAR